MSILAVIRNKFYMEVWKDIKGFEGIYQISNKGRVRRINTQKIVKSWIAKHPTKPTSVYYRIGLWNKGKRKLIGVHQLVAAAYVEKPVTNELLEVNHKDNDKLNNVDTNLEWITHQENVQHYYSGGYKK